MCKVEDISNITPCSENLLLCSRTLWQYGDWDSLVKLNVATLENHPDRAIIALFISAGYQQTGDMLLTKRFVHLAQDWNCDSTLIKQILVAGTYNTLGKIAALLKQEQRSRKYFETALSIGMPSGDIKLLAQARMKLQCNQIKRSTIIESACITKSSQFSTCIVPFDSDVPDLSIAQAEVATYRQNYTEAARCWLNVACVLGQNTPQNIYDRLSEAYAKINDFGGTEEENKCWGDKDKHNILANIHQILEPDLYLEIGVDQGISLSLAKCNAIGIDPRPQLNLTSLLGEKTKIITTSSDNFFSNLASIALPQPPDLVFIDGMHLFEFALRDFINVERFASPTTLVVIDDIHPCHPAQAERVRRTGSWTGDVWKLHKILREYRPELIILDLNAFTTGLLLVAGLDSGNSILTDSYEEIIRCYAGDIVPPANVLERKDSIASCDVKVDRLLTELKSARKTV